VPGSPTRNALDGRRPTLAHALDDDERDAVHDESHRDDVGTPEVLLHPVVERNADDGGRQAGDDGLCPERPGVAALETGLGARERVEPVEEEHEHGDDGTELDHHEEHVPEVRGHVQRHELVEQQHVPRR